MSNRLILEKNGDIYRSPATYNMLKRKAAANYIVSEKYGLPQEVKDTEGSVWILKEVTVGTKPEGDVVTLGPIVESNGSYSASWESRDFTQEEIDAESLKVEESLKKSFADALQLHLDTEARTKSYDGILSLCTYAASVSEPFKSEGIAGLAWRDACWSYSYVVLNDIKTSARTIPTIEEFIAEMPAMVWP